MRRRAGTSGPYSVGRSQRGQYNDGDPSLAKLWRDRPYSDAEPPHPNADPDIDAADAGVGVPNTRLSPPVSPLRSAADAKDKEPELDYDEDLAYGTSLWAKVAPLVNGVADLMKNSDSADKLRAILDSKGVSNAKLIQYVVERAVRLGFGFRYTQKDWQQFRRLVPACTMLKQDYYRSLLEKALEVAGVGRGYEFANQPSDLGFRPLRGGSEDDGDPQEAYEERAPGRVPGLETKNIEGWLRLYRGKTGELEEDAWRRITKKKIVDTESARFSTDRLQSALRYAFEMPDSPFAMALIVAVALREAMRLTSEKGDDHLARCTEMADPGVTADEVLSGISASSSAILEKWISIAVSSLFFVGALPPPKSGSYDEVRDAIRRSLAGIAVAMLRRFFGLLARAAPKEREDAPRDERPQRIVDEMSKRAREAMAAMEDRTGENADRSAVQALRNAMKQMRLALERGDADALAAAAVAVVAALSAAGVEDVDGLADVRRAAQEMRPNKSASITVADIAKRIVSPARHRIVTREEAEDGIEVGDEAQELRLPTRYHAVSQALAPSGGH